MRILVTVIASLFSLVSSAGAAPNIILFVSDDQGWTGSSVPLDPTMPSSSDYYETPELERLASEGTRFSRAYAPAPNCSPTRASLLTGRSPAALQITDVVEQGGGSGTRCGRRRGTAATLPGLPSETTTIAEALKATDPDYVAGHFGKWHLAGGGPGNHGFDEHDGSTTNTEGNLFEPGNPKDVSGVSTRAEEFMSAQVQAGRPFFLQVSHYAVHTEIDALPATILKYQSKAPGSLHSHPEYAAMTEDLDSGLGRILDAVQDLGIEDDTYVLYISDHGAPASLGFTNNLPLAEGKATLFEGGIRVPLVVRGPGIDAGAVSPVPVIGWDVFPTILDWAGDASPTPPEVEGTSLRTLLETGGQGSVVRPREEFVWHLPHYIHWAGTTPVSAIRLDEFKLIHWYDSGQVQLFDLRLDPSEAQDLSADPAHSERVAEMSARLDDYLVEVGASMPGEAGEVATVGLEFMIWLGAVTLASWVLRRLPRGERAYPA